MAQITGKVTRIMPVVSGENDNGEWYRGGFVIASIGDVTRVMAFNVFGQRRLDMITDLKVGDTVLVDYYAESREWADKWFTDLMAIKVSVAK